METAPLESLDLRAIVRNRHLQVHELDLRQSRNHLLFSGECVLPPPVRPEANPAEPQITEDWWKQAAFSCNIDARLDELQALSDLLAPEMPAMKGRMSANGKITARGGDTRGYEGYLNVEGSNLSIRGAPLDSLRSTLSFHGQEMQIADLQVTHAGDYFAGLGTLNIVGPFRYQAELRGSAKELSVYSPAYQGIFIPQPINGALQLDWSGDGTATAHSGAFRGTMERFFTSAGGGVMPRPVNLEAEGTYSPVSLSVRRLTLVDGEGTDRHEAIKIEGAVPWNQDARQWADGYWMDTTRPVRLVAECHDAPLDILAALVPAYIRAARGRISGNIEARDAWKAPILNGALQLKDADFLWADPRRQPLENINASFKLDQSLVNVDECTGKRAGEAFVLRGNVDLHDATNPNFALDFFSNGTVHAEDGRFTAHADYHLKIEGEETDGMLVSGDIKLTNGGLRRRLEFTPDLFPGPLDVAPQELRDAFVDMLPKDLSEAHLNLHLATGEKFRLDETTAAADMAADLQVTGTWREPQLSGSILLKNGRIFLAGSQLTLTDGILIFAPEQPMDNPVLSFWSVIPADQDNPNGDRMEKTAYFSGPRNEGKVQFLPHTPGGSEISQTSNAAEWFPSGPATNMDGCTRIIGTGTESLFSDAMKSPWPQQWFLQLR